MSERIATLALVVRDYDEAIIWFRDLLGFRIEADEDRGGGKRWVVMRPDGGGVRLLLAKATTPGQESRIGDQTGGRVFLFLETDDLVALRARMEANGVVFEEATREEPYGLVAVFRDLYGNRWDLLQPAGK